MTRDYSTEIAASTSLARGISISNNIYYMQYESMNITNLFIYTMCIHTDDMHF